MTRPGSSRRRAGTKRLTTGIVLVAAGAALGALIAIAIFRALAGYEITPFAADEKTTVTVDDRPVALWVAPQDSRASCTAFDDSTERDSFAQGSAEITLTDGGETWRRVGLVRGAPGSTHTVECLTANGSYQLGYADNPRIARWVVIGVVGGLGALLLVSVGTVLIVVGALRRRRPV